MGASITFDDSHWPLLISRFRGAATDSEYEEYLARGTAYLQRGDLYVSVLDMGQLVMPTVAQRQRQAEWVLEHAALMRERLLGCALIITSPFVRLALSAVLHIRPLPTPYVTVHDLAGGVRWTAAQLESAGLLEAVGRIRRDFGL
ncbi:hypothetical protein [Vitiosangium sp. GDMCC 1.1324]|uniref:hypothetical protein n=1 Tax=Vitiosangium sp. (strain GDMCC 1.1324) TaxID=2138576 RepID=UPI000D38BBB6|nr:hypothetical protein [Vitiosangium sp. GDMCC 1.1324]PTL85172.1 hypothetical protein DAT35_00110 [Vitiosangium sp. GDMCC 1.1324]